jgi:hypothetical protein
MIKGINSSSRYVTVSGGSPGGVYISPGSVGAGMMRYNGNTNCIEVNDGNSWLTMSANYASIELTPETEMLLEWARKKRDEELELKMLSENHPAIKAAMEAVERAQQQLKLIRDLSIEHEPS